MGVVRQSAMQRVETETLKCIGSQVHLQGRREKKKEKKQHMAHVLLCPRRGVARYLVAHKLPYIQDNSPGHSKVKWLTSPF